MKPRHWIRNIFLQLSKKPDIIVFFADIVKVQKISVIVIFFTHLVITGLNISVEVDPSVSTIRNNICRKTKEATRMWSSHSERSAHQSGGYHWPHLHSHIPSASGGWDRRRAGHCGNTGQSAALATISSAYRVRQCIRMAIWAKYLELCVFLWTALGCWHYHHHCLLGLKMHFAMISSEQECGLAQKSGNTWLCPANSLYQPVNQLYKF